MMENITYEISKTCVQMLTLLLMLWEVLLNFPELQFPLMTNGVEIVLP